MKIYSNSQALSVIDKCVASTPLFPYGMPALLVGETGVGKTTIIREVAIKHKKKLTRVNLNGQTGVEELLGKMLIEKGATYWQDGILVRAMKEGDWVVFDEINAALPEVLFILNSLLDEDRKLVIAENQGEEIKPHKEFRFFAGMNPVAEYAGTKELNKALLSRFGAVLEILPLEEHAEFELLNQQYEIDEDSSRKLAKIGKALRAAKKEEKIFFFCSTRDLIHTGQLIMAGIEFGQSVIIGIVNKAGEDDREEIMKILNNIASVALPKTDYEEFMAQMKSKFVQVAEEAEAEKKKFRDAYETAAGTTEELVEKINEFFRRMADELSKESVPKAQALAAEIFEKPEKSDEKSDGAQESGKSDKGKSDKGEAKDGEAENGEPADGGIASEGKASNKRTKAMSAKALKAATIK